MSFRACRFAVVVFVLIGAAGCGHSSETGRPSPEAGSAFTLVQMNLCLSGIASCYGVVAYPAGVTEATSVIRKVRPDAVTISEACEGDAARIAKRQRLAAPGLGEGAAVRPQRP